jgi:hypothetical protein
MAQLVDWAGKGHVDEAIELFVARDDWAEDADGWQALVGVANKLSVLEKQRYKTAVFSDLTHPRIVDGFPVVDFRLFVKRETPKILVGKKPDLGDPGRVVARGEEIVAKNPVERPFFGSLLVASDSVRVTSAHFSVVLSGGPIEVEKVDKCVVLCDGDFDAQEADGSLIVARGKVRVRRTLQKCHVITSATVEYDKDAPASQNDVKENEATPFGFVNFFDPAQVGVTVVAADGGVRVKDVDAKKPFGRAGLKADDLILPGEGEKAGSPEQFRRLLRRKVVLREEWPLKVRRGDKTLDVVIPLGE